MAAERCYGLKQRTDSYGGSFQVWAGDEGTEMLAYAGGVFEEPDSEYRGTTAAGGRPVLQIWRGRV